MEIVKRGVKCFREVTTFIVGDTTGDFKCDYRNYLDYGPVFRTIIESLIKTHKLKSIMISLFRLHGLHNFAISRRQFQDHLVFHI